MSDVAHRIVFIMKERKRHFIYSVKVWWTLKVKTYCTSIRQPISYNKIWCGVSLNHIRLWELGFKLTFHQAYRCLGDDVTHGTLLFRSDKRKFPAIIWLPGRNLNSYSKRWHGYCINYKRSSRNHIFVVAKSVIFFFAHWSLS